MKSQASFRARGSGRANPQQIMFELKQKVVLALNKLTDRDTYHIGADELEKTVQCLNQEGIAPFLSCILDTDSDQKCAVRRECVRLMGSLAKYHQGLVGPYLVKMVCSIVKRLKDSDSGVRDACVETVGVLALSLNNRSAENDDVFITLVRPLFEALGEQNKQVQLGSALCLARVIDNTRDPPPSILQRMLTRTIKLLKNPHFMAKPAVLDLNRSIIQAGGARTENGLSAAVVSIQEALKSTDWATRKAASLALADLASNGGSFLGTFRMSCIRSLEACRFDKVKPVRDIVLQALHCWRNLPAQDHPEPSECGSSIKENSFGGDFSDLTSASESGRMVISKRVGAISMKKRTPLSARMVCQNFAEKQDHSKSDEWHVEIAVPRTTEISVEGCNVHRPEGSFVTNKAETISADTSSMQDIVYDYSTVDDQQECSSFSNLGVNGFKAKAMTVSKGCISECFSHNLDENTQQGATEEISSEEHTYLLTMQDRKSLDSTVTESSYPPMFGCCQRAASEMFSIRKKLFDIENKQSKLLNLLQVFATSSTESLSLIKMKVVALEHAVDRISQDHMHDDKYAHWGGSKNMKKDESVDSPRLSTCTPRPSIDIQRRQPSSLAQNRSEFWDNRAIDGNVGRSRNLVKKDGNLWMDSNVQLSTNYLGKDLQKFSERGVQSNDSLRLRKGDGAYESAQSLLLM